MTAAAAPRGFDPELPIERISECASNHRGLFDPALLAELTESIRQKGVLQPVLVRPSGDRFELVFGHRRLRAAKAAGLRVIPATIRELDDLAVLEAQLIENCNRADVHPLEEAAGYKALLGFGQSIERVAERLGRSVKYVYDRIKLLNLTPGARKVFEDGEITAGHAIILARLTPEEQTRAIEDTREGVFQHERRLYDPRATDEDGEARLEARKARSVRELQRWVDQHVRFRPESVDPVLFPDTATAIEEAQAAQQKVVLITYEHVLSQDAKDPNGPRVYSVRSWKNASGEGNEDPAGARVGGKARKSKACDKSRLGVFIAGPGRGDTLQVCVSKSCAVHWPQEKPAGKRGSAASKASQLESYEKQEAAQKAARERQEAERARWKKALPAIRTALAEKIEALGVKPNNPVWNLASSSVYGLGRDLIKKAKDADGFLRALALGEVERLDEWRAQDNCPRLGKAFGVDVKKILDEAAPEPKAEKPAPAKKAAGPRGKKK